MQQILLITNFDPDDRADRFRRLRSLMKTNGLHQLSEKFEIALKPYENLVSNMLTIRSMLVAHKQSGVDSAELYEKHGVRPDQIGDILNTLANLMRELERHLNNDESWGTVGPTNRWEKATFGLLAVLRKGRNS